MKKNRVLIIKKSLILILITIGAAATNSARAITVFDPTNFSQNILTAIRSLQSNLNEARMLANQVQQLSNDLKNLTALPYSITDDFTTQMHDLFEAVGRVQGLMQNLATLEARFDELYPDFNNEPGVISGTEVAQKANDWLNESRSMMLQASITGAKVLEDLPRTHDRLDRLLVDSSNSVGILQAAQAGNQIAATVAGNLTTLNTLVASQTQAQAAFLMQMNAEAASARNRMNHVLDGYKPSTAKGIPLNSY